MSWIKDNKFAVVLGSGTLVGSLLLVLAGSKAAARYQLARDDFEASKEIASGYENLALYPRLENCDGKGKALEDYRQSTEAIQAAFASFRPKELKTVSPQVFTNQLKAVNSEIVKACQDADIKIPEPFFCGFENYKTSLALGKATGILTYQLEGIQNLMLTLARSGVTELQNFHRPLLPEEEGRDYQIQSADVARPLPVEITFTGPEKSVRAFLSDILRQEHHYAVIRSMAVSNSKQDPPRAGDAKFDKAPVKPDAAGGAGDFVLPGDKPEAPKPEGALPPPAVDTSRILMQVLGDEELRVFLRLDLMEFLPAKKLP